MKERLTRQLGPEARQALRLAKQVCGQEPVLKQVQELPTDARAMLVHPETPQRPYEIHFARGEERVLDHLVAHEVGHLTRFYQVPVAERLMPALTPACRRGAAAQIIAELAQVVDYGLPEEAVPDLFEVWHHGVCIQVANFPADLRIEAWIHSQFPGLRLVQRRSLMEEVQRSLPLFHPDVVRFTPPTVYRATMAMNAAQAYQVAEFYHNPSLMEPFKRHGFGAIGRWLVTLALGPEDQGHRSDMQAANVWARELGLSGWFEWQPYWSRSMSVGSSGPDNMGGGMKAQIPNL